MTNNADDDVIAQTDEARLVPNAVVLLLFSIHQLTDP